MEKEVFIKQVQKELDRIKKKATAEEIKKLVFSRFNENSVDKCIYGLMTGFASSKRACQIQRKTFDGVSDGWGKNQYKFKNQDFSDGISFTALEKYLYMTGKSTHREIFRYLKGKVETINLNVI